MSEIVRDIRQQPFYWIDRHFLPTYGAKIGPHGIAVYNALAYRADRTGRAFPGASDLMKLTGIRSRNTLRRALSDLENAGLITINRRNTGMTYESNEYFLLPVEGQEITEGRSSNDRGRSGDDRGVGQEMTGVGHLMTGGRSGDDRGVGQEMTTNNNHITTSNNNMHEQQAGNNNKVSLPAAAAAASLLKDTDIDLSKINGTANELAAWICYAKTQPNLKNPVGYAIARVKNNERAPAVCGEIISIDMAWDDLLRYATYESMYRKNPSVQGLDLYEELENVSDEAISILCDLWEMQR